jgi:hypothetical protein
MTLAQREAAEEMLEFADLKMEGLPVLKTKKKTKHLKKHK